ncbi:hypothetical protein OKW34_008370 [Paraburkholderia youngii]|uniref:hypothetical protein n=1 Tax=Paraburkholderia youngii TaxID=2782701 RepID=UPI003D20FF17
MLAADRERPLPEALGPAFFAYSTNYLIDLQAGINMDVEATPANRSQEVGGRYILMAVL